MTSTPAKVSFVSVALLVAALVPAIPVGAQTAVERDRAASCSEKVAAALDRIASALEAQLSDRRVELMMRRVDLAQRRLDPLVSRLDAARSHRSGLTAEQTRLQQNLDRIADQVASGLGETSSSEWEMLTLQLESELEIVSSQASSADATIVRLENQAERLRQEINEWISWLDRNLEGP